MKAVLDEDRGHCIVSPVVGSKPQFNQAQVDYLAMYIKDNEVHHNFKEDSIDRVALCAAEHCGMRILLTHIQHIVIAQV